jgi:hypothetical protein
MEYQKILLLATVLIIGAAVYIMITIPQAPPAGDSEAAESLMLKSSSFGRGLGEYIYSYSEVSDGYKTTYTLDSSGGQRMAEVLNPLSTKRVYILRNDTVFCIKYPVNETCTSIEGNSEMANYVAFIQSKFFNDTIIDRSRSNLEYLLSKGYLRLEPDVADGTSGTFACKRISYIIDYSNLSLDEAARFGISSDSPKRFALSACIEETSGLAYETTLGYSDNSGVQHTRVMRVSSFKTEQLPLITPPLDLSGDAISVLRKEREQQVRLATCHTDKQGEEREKCVSDIALQLRRKDLCELTGERRDRCLVALVPLTKDTTICSAISDSSFKDDCYIELAGAYKDGSFCSSVKDPAKIPACQAAAAQRPASNQTSSGNATTSGSGSQNGSSGSGFDAQGFLNYIDRIDGENNSTNGTGG